MSLLGGGAARPRRRRARGGRRHRARGALLPRHRLRRCSDEPFGKRRLRRARDRPRDGRRGAAAAPRRDGASQRPADPRAHAWAAAARTPRRPHRGRLGPEAGVLAGAARVGAAAPRARCGWPRRSRSSRSPAAACPRRGCRSRTRACSSVALATAAASGRRIARGSGRPRVAREGVIAALGVLPGAGGAARSRPRRLPRRRAQGDRRLRARQPRPRRRPQGARALRLQPDRAAADPLGRRPADRRAAVQRVRGRCRGAVAAAGERLGRGGAVRLRRAAARTRRSAAPSTRSGTRSSALVSTREPTAEQLEVGSAALHEILRAEAASLAGHVQAKRGTADTV